MRRYGGKAVGTQTAVGKIFYYHKPEDPVEKIAKSDPDAERERIRKALETADQQLQKLYEDALEKTGAAEAEVFEMHRMMLQDDDFQETIFSKITAEEVNAEYAVACAQEEFVQIFSQMDDEYMRERADDIRDISRRLRNILTGREQELVLAEPVILAAEDLMPSETIRLDKSKILGFVIRQGSLCSHTAILAKTMNIPALIGVDVDESWHGKMAILDEHHKELILDPEDLMVQEAKRCMEKEKEENEELRQMIGLPTITKGGKTIQLYANIGNVADATEAVAHDAEGIGLFRSEFLYLEGNDYPTEEEQFEAYKAVLLKMNGKRVVIRTMDIGADKKADYFQLEPEENPALGFRAIRICLQRKELFETQLRALLRASLYGKLAVMFPMITSVKEVREIRTVLLKVKEDLKREGTSFGDIEFGIMIETPAAVMISEELAEEVDFFSIGTNDLTQYTLAIDRQNSVLEPFYDAHHPAVLRMIRMTIENGHKAGIWVGICGELASDMELTKTFLDMGVDELSVSPGRLLALRKKIRESL